jgi:outer membrane protein OmpA-like peptidoglycan-associated protein
MILDIIRRRAVMKQTSIMKSAPILILLTISAVFALPAYADDASSGETFSMHFLPGDKLKITERSNLRKTENNRFQGLSYREVRGIMEAVPAEGVPDFSGKFYIFEETKHDAALVAKRIDRVVPTRFSILPDGNYSVSESYIYPTLRNFPTFPDKPLKPGEKWEAYGMRIVEPFRDGVFTRVRFYCGYEYKGIEEKDGREYRIIAAQYAMRYKQGQDPYGDERIISISGKHMVKIYFDLEGKRPYFMQDIMDETYLVRDNKSLIFKGFILTWFDGIVTMDRSLVADDIERALADAGVSDVSIEEKEEGVALTINKVHFVADQAAVLPGEKGRLSAVAEALKNIEERTFLVIGHTADVGREEEQYVLSVERAKTIVDYLVAQGIDSRRFIFEGRGGTEPVAPNDTEENRAKNRRVEIIILED